MESLISAINVGFVHDWLKHGKHDFNHVSVTFVFFFQKDDVNVWVGDEIAVRAVTGISRHHLKHISRCAATHYCMKFLLFYTCRGIVLVVDMFTKFFTIRQEIYWIFIFSSELWKWRSKENPLCHKFVWSRWRFLQYGRQYNQMLIKRIIPACL